MSYYLITCCIISKILLKSNTKRVFLNIFKFAKKTNFMTDTKKNLFMFTIIAAAVVLLLSLTTLPVCVANADGEIFDLMTPAIVKFYEKDFNPNCPVTSITAQKREILKKKLNASSNKLDALIIIKDVTELNGKQVSLEKLNAMPVKDLLAYAKDSFEKYVKNQPKEKQEKIVSDFKKLGFSFKGFLKKFATI